MINIIMNNLDEKLRQIAEDELKALEWYEWRTNMIELSGGIEELKKIWQRSY